MFSLTNMSARGGKTIFLTIAILFALSPVLAATDDFTADGDITVTGVTFGVTTADMLIMNTSTAESWTFDSGAFTVTNPGTFMVGSINSDVKSIKFMQGSTNLACAANTTPGTSYATAPTAAGTYTVTPSTTTDCTSLCTALSNTTTYNSFPTCGSATCDSGYEVSGSGASATCVASACATLSNVATYNAAPTCGAATCNSGYTLSGTGTSATCVAVGGGIPITILNQINQQQQNQTPTAPATPVTPTTPTIPGKATLTQMLSEAQIVNTADVKQILTHMSIARNNDAEKNYYNSIVNKIISGNNISPANINKIINFVTYGTQSTAGLGAGERGGVVNSFKSAFGKLPETEEDWNDVIKIANGRWPGKTNANAEDRAKNNFKIVYKREPDRSNPHDDAAITVMAYGLRPANRNLESEKNAIKFFKAIYGYNPEKATAWDVVRAIAYSGATR